MKSISTAIVASLLLLGCSGIQTYKAPTQTYRLKGEDKTVQINGALFRQTDAIKSDVFAVGIYFDEQLSIQVSLDKGLNGEAAGKPYKGNSTSATCHGNKIPNGLHVECLVFIDNERTVTLTF